MTTEQLEARQQAALTKNNDRKRLLRELAEALAAANAEVARLASAGQQVEELSTQLTKSNMLLEQLQDAVLSDTEDTAPPAEDPPVEPPVEEVEPELETEPVEDEDPPADPENDDEGTGRQ